MRALAPGIVLGCLLLSAGCRSEPIGGPDSGPSDLATSFDLASADLVAAPCAALGPCDCIQSTQCVAISSACWCPFPDCGEGACACGGGFYYGCSPRSANCPSIDCGPAGAAVGPDARGCFFCGPKVSCDVGRARLQTACGFSSAFIAGLTCDKNPDCVGTCMATLKRCEEVGCMFCETCDCIGINEFYKCVTACRQ